MRAASGIGLLFVGSLAGSAALALDDAKNRPVSKVVTLLKDMIAQMEKEGQEDEEVYEAMGCWCETNDKEKTKAIADGEARIGSLQAAIEELTAESSRLNTEIKNLQTEVQNNQNALDTATALRQKQLGEFNEEEKDLLQSISSLKSAVTVLSKQNSALLQAGEQLTLNARVSLHDVLRKNKGMLTGVITPSQSKLLESFTQDGAGYAPQSGEIFGILSQMKETFETNLANTQKEEMENLKAYNDLKSAKNSEIKAGQEQADTKTVELGNVDEKNAQSKQDLEDTRNSLAADTAFLADLKEKCASMDSEYEERVKARQMEITAVSKALEFLTSDEAQDLVSRSLGAASFLQRQRSSNIQAKLSAKLQKEAKKHHDKRLSELAYRVRLDKFEAVKRTIQGMVDKLHKEKEDDIKKKDFCVDSFNQNERETSSEDRNKADLVAKVEDLTMTMDTLSKNIEELKAEVASMQSQMKAAGEQREKMNKEFQLTVADQRATQKLIASALNVLKTFYDKAALVQVAAKSRSAQPAGPPPPPGFKKRENNAGSGGVMGMMQMIIDDAKAMEAQAIQAEEDSQKAYEAFVNDTNTAIDDAIKDITNKSDSKARAEAEKVETEAERDESISTLEGLSQANMDLHRSCDFLMKNFDLRAAARDEEVEALKQGIAMFDGASFTALLQGP